MGEAGIEREKDVSVGVANVGPSITFFLSSCEPVSHLFHNSSHSCHWSGDLDLMVILNQGHRMSYYALHMYQSKFGEKSVEW